MTAMSTVLAIIALLATASADVAEFRKDIFEAAALTDPGSKAVEVSLINADLLMEFSTKKQQNAVKLEPHSLPTGKYHKLCKSSLGIKILSSNEVFCNITHLSFEAHNLENSEEQYIKLTMLFEWDTTEPFRLDVPIFKHPAGIPSANQKAHLNSWGLLNQVGDLAPVDLGVSNIIEAGKPLKVDFNWLKKVLRYGITKSNSASLAKEKIGAGVASYTTRPIVMANAVLQQLMN